MERAVVVLKLSEVEFPDRVPVRRVLDPAGDDGSDDRVRQVRAVLVVGVRVLDQMPGEGHPFLGPGSLRDHVLERMFQDEAIDILMAPIADDVARGENGAAGELRHRALA